MNKEDLKKLGIEDEELIQKVIVLHGKDIETHKNSIQTVKSELETVKTQLSEANTTIEGFKKLNVDEIKKAADDWKAKAEQAQLDAQKQVGELKFSYALDSALAGAKAKNTKAVKALLKTEDLKLAEDGSLVGLKEQLEKVKAENDYLFETDEPAPKIVAGGGSGQPVITDSVVEAARKAAGLPVNK